MTLTAQLTGAFATELLFRDYFTAGDRLSDHYQQIKALYGFGASPKFDIEALTTNHFHLGPAPLGWGYCLGHEILTSNVRHSGHNPPDELVDFQIRAHIPWGSFGNDSITARTAALMAQQVLMDVLSDPDESGYNLDGADGVKSLSFGLDSVPEPLSFGGKPVKRWGVSVRGTIQLLPSDLTVTI